MSSMAEGTSVTQVAREQRKDKHMDTEKQGSGVLGCLMENLQHLEVQHVIIYC